MKLFITPKSSKLIIRIQQTTLHWLVFVSCNPSESFELQTKFYIRQLFRRVKDDIIFGRNPAIPAIVSRLPHFEVKVYTTNRILGIYLDTVTVDAHVHSV